MRLEARGGEPDVYKANIGTYNSEWTEDELGGRTVDCVDVDDANLHHSRIGFRCVRKVSKTKDRVH